MIRIKVKALKTNLLSATHGIWYDPEIRYAVIPDFFLNPDMQEACDAKMRLVYP